MLKKAGILVAATAAGLLAVSPLAFAGEKGYAGNEGQDDETSFYYEDGDDNENSIVDTEIEDSSVNNCENDQESDVDNDGEGAGLLAGLGVLSVLDGNNVNALQCVNLLNNFLNENETNVDVL